MQLRLAAREPDPEARVAAVMAAHGRALLRVANHWSLCHDDALDAYQRGLEIFLRRADSVDPATELAWLKVVIKHEALAIRRARSDGVNGDEPDLDAVAPVSQRSVEEHIAGGERVSRSAEALRALKPDERRALLLKAEGLSYTEIGERCGWTYTKVNRAITEGRRRFMKAYAAIEAGDECDRYAPVLVALADGTATSAQVVEIRPHLRHCMACRATVRRLHMSRLRRAQLLLPVFAASFGAENVRTPEEILRDAPPLKLPDSTTPPAEVTGAPDAVSAGPHIGDLPGQLTLPLDLSEHVEHARRLRIGRIKDEAIALLHRTSSSDVAAGIHIATTTGGGGRIATIATILGFCISGAGAGALCVATGVVQAPKLFPSTHDAPDRKPVQRKRRASASVIATATPQTTPTPTITPKTKTQLSSPTTDPSVRARPTRTAGATRRRPSSRSSARASQTAEFGFEDSVASTVQTADTPAPPPPPPPAPAPGGNSHIDPAQEEFGP